MNARGGSLLILLLYFLGPEFGIAIRVPVTGLVRVL